MNKSELRVNNYVIQNIDGKETIVKLLTGSDIDKAIESGAKELPLTVKRAEQFGFKKVSEERWTLKHFNGFELSKASSGSEYFSAVKYISKDSFYLIVAVLKSVHHLQNLYREMAESELIKA